MGVHPGRGEGPGWVEGNDDDDGGGGGGGVASFKPTKVGKRQQVIHLRLYLVARKHIH